ncbi:restriction endonuclease subunit S [Arthrobacter sp. H35-D1]|uniref:restriction endonuclease subunit S n=1 Tax=Arthrobacter sp. H35-D1 TaxID=3046202 RepID=UPI0024B9F5FB|nr:restriction endonuclease subunit S [Arthrobacter sp. H35-D1]MDJ0312027.1 restriction endonuclease subunit S [Arthrobacter sp. H35-D1]
MSELAELPSGWAWTTLTEISENLDRLRVPLSAAERAKRPGSVPYYGATGQVGTIDAEIFNEDLVLLGEDGVQFFDPSKTKAYRISGPAWVNNHAHVLRATNATTNSFLHYYLNTFNFEGYANGTTRLKLTKSAANSIPFPLPPLAEQHRIVEALEEQLSRLDEASSLLSTSARRASAFRLRLNRYSETATMTNAYALPPSPADVDDVDLPKIPNNWRWGRLEEIADVVGGITKDAKKQSDPALTEVPYLRVANVQAGHLKLDVVTKIRATEKQIKKLLLQPGDVLLNEGGDRDKLGRGWIWEGAIDNCIHQNHVFRIRVRENAVLPELIAWHANSYGRKWFERNGKQSVNLASVSLRVMKKFPIPIPPVQEQDDLVTLVSEQLDGASRLVNNIEGLVTRNGRLRERILASAFAGTLVDQNPADEPASILLERIAAERAAAKPAVRRRTSVKAKV